jgi:catechol 2,3-dioxygenase
MAGMTRGILSTEMATAAEQAQRVSIDPDASIGTVRLTVADLARSSQFYEQAIGLSATEQSDGTVALGPPGGASLIELRGDSSAPALDRRATGLFHLAVLLPTRADLALALIRLARARWPLDGASDHLVSEALYLSDPDGNGIEIYRDRPRSEWPHSDGQLQMATIPLDLDDVLESAMTPETGPPAPPEVPATVPDGTRIGHVHLQVSELADTEAFYSGVLGLDVMVRGYPGALFVSAGGYHHHIGLNTWHSAGSEPPAPGSVGLRSFELLLSDERSLEAVLARVSAAGLPVDRSSHAGALVRDPSGNGVLLSAGGDGRPARRTGG